MQICIHPDTFWYHIILLIYRWCTAYTEHVNLVTFDKNFQKLKIKTHFLFYASLNAPIRYILFITFFRISLLDWNVYHFNFKDGSFTIGFDNQLYVVDTTNISIDDGMVVLITSWFFLTMSVCQILSTSKRQRNFDPVMIGYKAYISMYT